MPLHWGQIQGSNIFAVGFGTYRGKLFPRRRCIGAIDNDQNFVFIQMPIEENHVVNNLNSMESPNGRQDRRNM